MIVVDIETLGTADLTKVGQVNYARHKDTMISVLAWKVLKTGKTYSLVHPKLATKVPDEETIKAFTEFLSSSEQFIAHNASFEMELFNHKLEDFAEAMDVDYTMFNKYTLSRFIDTQTLSNIFRGPGSLAAASQFFKLDVEKDIVGKNIMKAVCTGKTNKPRNMKTTAKKVPAVWVEIKGVWYKAGLQVYDIIEEYCRQDVETTALLYEKLSSPAMMKDLGSFAPDIKVGMRMAETMNHLGVLTDEPWLNRLGVLRDNICEQLDKHCMKSFGLLPNQRLALKKVINNKGYILNGMGRPDIEKSFRENEGKEEIKNQLKKYMAFNKTSLKKIDSAVRQTNPLTRELKYMFKFCGAYATGRFSSYGVQLQNLPRTKKDFDITACKKMIKNKKMDYDPNEVVSAIRGAFVPRKGYKFFIADLSQIELRRVLIKAGYLDRQQYLVGGGDLYSDLATAFFKKKITDNDEERQVGKAFLLALGYGMGVNKFIDNFEKSTGKKIDENTARNYIGAYKQKYPKVIALWGKYQEAMKRAFYKQKEFRVKLASGRYLNYGKLVERRFKQPDGRYNSQICYYNGKMWSNLYGSMIFQHVIQAECRDILLIKMNDLYSQGARIVMQVHDEVVVEIPENKTLDVCSQAWYNAGMDRIKELFPNMIIDSECVFTDRYWSH